MKSFKNPQVNNCLVRWTGKKELQQRVCFSFLSGLDPCDLIFKVHIQPEIPEEHRNYFLKKVCKEFGAKTEIINDDLLVIYPLIKNRNYYKYDLLFCTIIRLLWENINQLDQVKFFESFFKDRTNKNILTKVFIAYNDNVIPNKSGNGHDLLLCTNRKLITMTRKVFLKELKNRIENGGITRLYSILNI